MTRARANTDRLRACPAGARRGVDVARMYPEIRRIVGAKFANAGVDVDDLVQETAAAIAVKNRSERSAFDPALASFGKYVCLVARSKLGHMLGGETRRAHAPVLEAEPQHTVHVADAEASPVDLTPETMADVVEHLADLADEARARGRGDASDAFRACAELLDTSFAPTTCAPLSDRVLALLAVAGGPLSSGQLSAGLLVPVAAVERALAALGRRVQRTRRGTYQLAPMRIEPVSPRSRPTPRRRAQRPQARPAASPSPASEVPHQGADHEREVHRSGAAPEDRGHHAAGAAGAAGGDVPCMRMDAAGDDAAGSASRDPAARAGADAEGPGDQLVVGVMLAGPAVPDEPPPPPPRRRLVRSSLFGAWPQRVLAEFIVPGWS